MRQRFATLPHDVTGQPESYREIVTWLTDVVQRGLQYTDFLECKG
jgi:hypothetical protein